MDLTSIGQIVAQKPYYERGATFVKDREMLDLSSSPLVDGHCHPFLPEREDADFLKLFTASTLAVPRRDSEHTLLCLLTMAKLAVLLGCPNEIESILKARKKLYSADPKAYVSKLFKAGKIDTLVLDDGYPSQENSGYSIPLDYFRALTDCRIKSLCRIETLLYELFREQLRFPEMLNQYEQGLEDSVKTDGDVGFKSAIAYVFGLRIVKVDEGAAKKVYARLIRKKLLTVPLFEKDAKTIHDERILRNFLLVKSIEKSIKLNVPFQIHTGFGESPHIDLREVNPLHLLEILSDPELSKAKIVLVHAGYPFIEETGYLANSYPNVYVDLSQVVPFASIGVKDKILRLLEMAPTTKVMYGSDATNIPELYWISAIWGKASLEAALQELINSRIVDEQSAYKIAEQILSRNATELYGL